MGKVAQMFALQDKNAGTKASPGLNLALRSFETSSQAVRVRGRARVRIRAYHAMSMNTPVIWRT